ncbi:MAG: glycerol-3-phosphate acyltransferase [Peptoniphilaceae bacterium]|nr:glycerol-3-phosphate acyltransferase [Peptoniphilaceae bacterium]MDD7383462.1 glycerol-3-phosphate acyltransferase [Peptoniphilaceae bacterium]MDY3738476.1 glycerol-3-phosphate acyltransferase [Peptoniphilaceae bacterium]
MINWIIIIFISIFLGGISFSYLIGKFFFKEDIRDLGSGNAGATNALRVFGIKAAIATFVFDALKCTCSVYIAGKLEGIDGQSIALLITVLSHMYPYTSNFRGGKGIASSIGGIMVIDYRIGIIVLFGVFFVLVLTTKIVSIGSISAAIAYPICLLAFYGLENKTLIITGFILSFVVLYKHRVNMKKILNKTESKLY